MEPQLATLVQLEGPEVLVREHVFHQLQGDLAPVWAEVTGVEQGTRRLLVQDNYRNRFPRSVEVNKLRVGKGSRKPDDPLILKMLGKGLFVQEFLRPEPPVNPQFGPNAPDLPQAPQASLPQPPPSRVQIPHEPVQKDPLAPGAALFTAFTPKIIQEKDLAGSAARFKKAFLHFVQKGSLIPHMETVLMEYPPDQFKSLSSKAKILFDIYKEPNAKAAHLQAAIHFYATRVNFMSLQLEYLANDYVTEMKMLLEEAGDSSNWSPDKVQELELKIKTSFNKYRAQAMNQVGKGNATPLVKPGQGGR
jgi:hypothetical protein